MAKYTQNDVPSGYTATQVNDELTKIESAINDHLDRKGGSGNQMEADLDMNSNDLLNADSIRSNKLYIGGTQVVPGETTEVISVIKEDLVAAQNDVDLIVGTLGHIQGLGDFEVVSTNPDSYYVASSNGFIKPLGVWTVDNIKDLDGLPVDDGIVFEVGEFYDDTNLGYNRYVWDGTADKADHNVGYNLDPVRLAAWDGTIGDISTLYTAGTGTGCFISTISNLKPHQFGAVKETLCYTQLNAYAQHMTSLQQYADFTEGPWYFDSTIDTSGSSVTKYKGDCEDSENTGTYNLIYLGTGVALSVDNLIHDQLGLAGLVSRLDDTPTTTTAIQATGTVTHNQSWLRNFDTIYDFDGGYYHEINEGGLRFFRKGYDFTTSGIGAYNFTTTAHHSEFVDGIIANGGDGPVRMGGSWEKMTGATISNNAGTPSFDVYLMSPYIENYPTTNVRSNLTGNPADFYISPRAMLFSESKVTGHVLMHVNPGWTAETIRFSGAGEFDISATFIASGTLTLSRLIYCPDVTSIRLDAKYKGSFGSVPLFTPGLAYDKSSDYIDYDGLRKTLETDLTSLLVNSWADAGGAIAPTPPSARIINNVVHFEGILDGTAATSDTIMTLPAELRPANRQRVTAYTSGSTAVMVQIGNAGGVTTTSRDAEVYISARWDLTN